jgi:hypothetical protein
LGEEIAPKKKKNSKYRDFFVDLKSPKTKRSREKPKPRRIKRNVRKKKKVKEAFADLMLCATS